ncbi:helix-turn-helix domain-containing protein [Streptomyces yangpuensis]|uniref:helix-turn-helix domain-containing protein n=1 Tax=Streptomyces yangpuensis TaxID=1648182 RepID=UPI0037FDC1EB
MRDVGSGADLPQGGEHVGGPGLSALRRRLADGLATARLNQTQLSARAGLGRTTVSEALSPRKPVPSAETVAALAQALKLPVSELLALQRAAAEEAGTETAHGPGRPIRECEPHELEVHPAGDGDATPGRDGPWVRALPGYVRRAHDGVLEEAVRDVLDGRSRMVVLVGTSSTGKTRACWEAVQPLADQRWRLWHPFDPSRAEAALEDLHRVGPRTVVWLNEAQHYLGDQSVGERIAAAVHRLLVSPERGPLLVLGTLWPEYATAYAALPPTGEADRHSRVRELLAGRTLSVPDAFDAQALAEAAVRAEGGDGLLADTLTRALTDGRIAQDLAGAPELLKRYEHGTPAARALLEAGMDARRLGVGPYLSQTFLTDAAVDYLCQSDYDQLSADWAELAYAQLARPVHGRHAPLRRTAFRTPRNPPSPSAASTTAAAPPKGPQLRLADYLEQQGRTIRRHLCPPASFWHAAYTHLTHPDDLYNLSAAAEQRHRLQWAHHLRLRAAAQGSPHALHHLSMMREAAGDRTQAEELARQAADHGSTGALRRLVELRRDGGDGPGTEALLRQAADHGDTDAMCDLAVVRELAGDRAGAERLFRQAADHGDTYGLYQLAVMHESSGHWTNALGLAREAAEQYGQAYVLCHLAALRERAGDSAKAESLLLEAAAHGDVIALYRLALRQEDAGDPAGAETFARQAAEHGATRALYHLAVLREKAGDRLRAKALAEQPADRHTEDAGRLAALWEKAGDREAAENLARRAADHGTTRVLNHLATVRAGSGDHAGAEALAREAAEHGDASVLNLLALRRAHEGDHSAAERLYLQAAEHGNESAMYHLARMRERSGDQAAAEAWARRAVAGGHPLALHVLAQMREDAGDKRGAETVARQSAERGNTQSLNYLAARRADEGDLEGAETLGRENADYGESRPARRHRVFDRLWPHGLNADGTPAPPWPRQGL